MAWQHRPSAAIAELWKASGEHDWLFCSFGIGLRFQGSSIMENPMAKKMKMRWTEGLHRALVTIRRHDFYLLVSLVGSEGVKLSS